MKKYFECSTTKESFIDDITKMLDNYKLKWSYRYNYLSEMYTFRIYTSDKIIKEIVIKYFIIINMLPDILEKRNTL